MPQATAKNPTGLTKIKEPCYNYDVVQPNPIFHFYFLRIITLWSMLQTQGKMKFVLPKARMMKVENKGILEFINTELALICKAHQSTDIIKFLESMPIYWLTSLIYTRDAVILRWYHLPWANFAHVDFKIMS